MKVLHTHQPAPMVSSTHYMEAKEDPFPFSRTGFEHERRAEFGPVQDIIGNLSFYNFICSTILYAY